MGRTLFSLDLKRSLTGNWPGFPPIDDRRFRNEFLLTNWWSLDSIASIFAALFVASLSLSRPRPFHRKPNERRFVSFPLDATRISISPDDGEQNLVEHPRTKGMPFESRRLRVHDAKKNTCSLTLGQFIPVFTFHIRRTNAPSVIAKRDFNLTVYTYRLWAFTHTKNETRMQNVGSITMYSRVVSVSTCFMSFVFKKQSPCVEFSFFLFFFLAPR